MRNFSKRILSRLNTHGGKSELDSMPLEIFQREMERKIRMGKNEQSIPELWEKYDSIAHVPVENKRRWKMKRGRGDREGRQ